MKPTHRFPRINGRRGAFQLLFGIVYGCLALAMSRKWPTSLEWMGEYMSHHVLVACWAIPTVAAFVGMFLPRPKDALSFALLTTAPILNGFLFIIGAFVAPEVTSPYGLIVYWALGAAVMVVSGMTGDRDRDERKVEAWKAG
ncbi:hypothetical protein ACLKOZ_17115 [Arthrobacter sp. R4]|uniref:hypothetical protein n=1 Tax=Arthrobacter sp. R4 TaxID=644417 RepID=UPI003EDA85FE